MSNNTENLKVYAVEDGGEYVWAITDDPEKARAISREYLRDSDNPEDYDPEGIEELPMGHMLRLNPDDDLNESITLTCAEWIEREGEGFLATTCY